MFDTTTPADILRSGCGFSIDAPLQKFLVTKRFPLGAVSLLAAPHEAGKSMLALNLALQVATGDLDAELPECLGQPVEEFGTAIMYTAHDSKDEIQRRLERLDPLKRHLINPQRLKIVPLPCIRGSFPLLSLTRYGFEPTAYYKDDLLGPLSFPHSNVKVIIFDPLISFIPYEGSHNPAAITAVLNLLASLAAISGTAVIVTTSLTRSLHGTPLASPQDARAALENEMSPLLAGVRAAYALWPATEAYQDKISKQLKKSGDVYMGALIKGNTMPSSRKGQLETYQRSDSGLLKVVMYS